MRKKITYIGWLCFGITCVFSACQFNRETEETDKQTASLDTLAYDYQHYTLYSDHVVKTSETTDTTFYAVSYPSFQDSTVDRFVLTTLLGNDTAAVKGTAQTFIGEFDDVLLSAAN